RAGGGGDALRGGAGGAVWGGGGAVGPGGRLGGGGPQPAGGTAGGVPRGGALRGDCVPPPPGGGGGGGLPGAVSPAGGSGDGAPPGLCARHPAHRALGARGAAVGAGGGALAMSAFLARFPLRHRAGRKMFVSVAVFGVMTLVFAVSRSVALSVAALAVLGAADLVSVVVRMSLVQLATPDAMRGRVSAVNWIFIGTSNQLGEFESGLAAAWFGTVPAVVLGGLGTLVVTALWAYLFPQLREVDSLQDLSP